SSWSSSLGVTCLGQMLDPARAHILSPSSGAFYVLCSLKLIDHLLVSGGVLDDQLRLAVDGQYERVTAFFDAVQHLTCVPLEVGERSHIVRQVDHALSSASNSMRGPL